MTDRELDITVKPFYKNVVRSKLLFSSDFFFFNVIIISTKGSAICQNYTPF